MIIELDLRESGQEVLVSEAFHVPGLLEWCQTGLGKHMRFFGHSAYVKTLKTWNSQNLQSHASQTWHDRSIYRPGTTARPGGIGWQGLTPWWYRRDRLVCYLCRIAFNFFFDIGIYRSYRPCSSIFILFDLIYWLCCINLSCPVVWFTFLYSFQHNQFFPPISPNIISQQLSKKLRHFKTKTCSRGHRLWIKVLPTKVVLPSFRLEQVVFEKAFNHC